MYLVRFLHFLFSSQLSHYTLSPYSDVLFKADSVSTVYAAYNFLIRLLRMHPPKDSLPFEWSDVENAVANLKLRLGIQHVKDR